MATDNEQLVLSISADVRQIQRQMKSLVGQTQRDTKAIESAFGGIDKAASGAFTNVAANSNRAFTTAEQGARRYQNAMRSSTVQTGNLAAQLNDIGVQLAGGQSPFLIALQQGTQINQALGSGVGARGAVSALAGAFTSLLNPVSLATIAIIGLGGEAIQYFTTLLSDGEASAKVLEKQAELIRNIAKEWGDTIPAIREYADELERAQKIAALQQGVQIINEQTLEDVKTSIKDASIEVTNLVNELQTAGEESDVILGLQQAFNEFTSAANDGSLKLEDVQRVQDALSAAINSTGIPSLDSFRTMFDNLAASALAAAGSVQKLNAETGAATTALYPSQGAYNGVDRSADGNIQNGGFMTPENGPTPESRPLIELEGFPKRGGGKTRDAAAEKIKREKEAVVELIAQLQFEQEMIGATDVERAKANVLRQAGAAATDEQKAKIAQLVEQTYSERDAINASKEAMLELQDVSRDVLEGVVSDLRAGKSGADIFANALDRVASRMEDSAFDSLFGGRGGGLGGIFSLFGGGGGKFPSAPGGLYADGGYTGDGGKYQPAGIVHKGEVVWSQRDVAMAGGVGVVEAMRKGYANGGAVGVSVPSLPSIRSVSPIAQQQAVDVRVSVDENGNLQAYVQRESSKVTRAGIQSYDKGSLGRTAANVRQMGTRGLRG